MPEDVLKGLTEVEIQVHQSEDTSADAYTVFFERANTHPGTPWQVRHIVRPDHLQAPRGKDPEKLE